ncbi:MAG: HigA family addiction module antitoxin [Vulcanimicrobiaceae bacterium]|jgi:addiction module HigA family antidote
MHRTLRIPTHGRPTPPGEMLLKEFLEPLGIQQKDFAERIGVTPARLNEIIKGRRAVTVDTAMRFARATGMSSDFWLRLQLMGEMYDAEHGKAAKEIRRIRPLPLAS